MEYNPEIKRIDVVLLGDFNPKIFSPAWFAANKLIGEHESGSAIPDIIHSDVTMFSMPWFQLNVRRDRFSIFTEQEAYFTALHDLVASTFQLLEHTPVHSLGYNWAMHLPCDSEEEWHEFGYYILPPVAWEGIFETSGLIRAELVNKQPPIDPLDGALRIRVEPSQQIKNAVFVSVNHHFEVPEKTKVMGCTVILEEFLENWDSSKELAELSIQRLIANFNGRS